MIPFSIIFLVIILSVLTNSLNLRNHGIFDDFYASSIAVFRNKAYLSLPRSSCYNNLTNPTLIEVYWNADKENVVPGKNIAFPSENHQKWGKCDRLQDAVSLDVDVKKGRLWVLDRGMKKCSPKIIVYNLYTNSEIYKYELNGINKNVTFLVVDSTNERDVVAYIGHDEDILTVFSLSDENHWSLKIGYSNKTETLISTKHLAKSKTLPVLYIGVDDSSELFSISLADVKKATKVLSPFSENLPKIATKLIGYKLGPSGGIAGDLAGGLNYFLARDHAVVRWITSKPLEAEYHTILMQSYEEMPYVPHLFMGPQNSVCALVNPLPPLYCDNEMEKAKIRSTENQHDLRKRVIKLFRLRKKGFGVNPYALDKTSLSL